MFACARARVCVCVCVCVRVLLFDDKETTLCLNFKNVGGRRRRRGETIWVEEPKTIYSLKGSQDFPDNSVA